MIDGSIASITVLLGAFAFFFLRSLAAHATAERLARENERPARSEPGRRR